MIFIPNQQIPSVKKLISLLTIFGIKVLHLELILNQL